MSSEISLKDQFLWVSNQRLNTLIAFAREVASESARSDPEREWLQRFRQFEDEVWPGIDFDLGERFPSSEEKKFWTWVYHEVAYRIFLRRIGDHSITSWQSSAIGDAYIIARMLTRAVQEADPGWHPVVDDTSASDEYGGGPINVRL